MKVKNYVVIGLGGLLLSFSGCNKVDLGPFGGGTVMGTKDGKGYYRTEMGGNWY